MAPYNPYFTLKENRLKSYKDWPVQLSQKPVKLAEAGLYYTGTSDRTVCFQCGAGFQAWDPEEDPWEKHSMWFSDCKFVKEQKRCE